MASTNPDIGKLCHSKNVSFLIYSKNDSSKLVFKAAEPEECTIRVQFGSQSWTCNKFSCYHEIQYAASGGSFEQGSGTVVSSYTAQDCAEFKVKPKAGSTSSFVFSVVANTSCGNIEHENPGASCSIAAAQKGATPRTKGNTQCQPNVAIRIYVNFDTNGKLTGIN